DEGAGGVPCDGRARQRHRRARVPRGGLDDDSIAAEGGKLAPDGGDERPRGHHPDTGGGHEGPRPVPRPSEEGGPAAQGEELLGPPAPAQRPESCPAASREEDDVEWWGLGAYDASHVRLSPSRTVTSGLQPRSARALSIPASECWMSPGRRAA